MRAILSPHRIAHEQTREMTRTRGPFYFVVTGAGSGCFVEVHCLLLFLIQFFKIILFAVNQCDTRDVYSKRCSTAVRRLEWLASAAVACLTLFVSDVVRSHVFLLFLPT
jgi:hypothetical protein